MSVDQSQMDLNTLQWVKSEIDETLKQARSALELHVEAPGESSHAKLITSLLHQVRGTLLMVELYGAAMLAEELENLAGEIAEKKIEGRDDIYEVMMQAMWQLPDYLERLQAGYKDIPMVLLPLLNDLRAARGQPLLSESALFTPDLNVEIPAATVISDESLPTLAKKLRHTYHLGLLDWFRERDPKGGLNKLDAVIEKLRQSANDAEVNRVLWSASGVLEALKQNGIEASVAVKLLLGQLDRQIKKIIDHGEAVLSKEPPAELEKNLLYYVASSSSTGERVNELKKKFKLAEALPDAETLEQARIDLTGPNAELMQTVSTVLLDNLLQVKDSLDVLVRSDEKDISVLPRLADDLSQIADTLGMLGFGKQRQAIQTQASVLRVIATEERVPNETELMAVADTLLSVEGLLQGNAIKVGETGVEQSMEMTAETQQNQLVESVMTEARANMSKVKDALASYIDMPRNTGLISDVPELLDQIRGSFEILDMQRAGELIAACRDYVQTSMIELHRSQDPSQMDALADAISSIEYYMDSVTGQWGNPESILNVAEERLNTIGVGLAEAPAPQAQDVDEVDDIAEHPSLEEINRQSDDTMIDLGSPDLVETDSDNNTDLMDIDLSDMSTAELSLADFEKELARQDEPEPQNQTQEIELDSALTGMDESVDTLGLDLSEQVAGSNDTQEIDLASSTLEIGGLASGEEATAAGEEAAAANEIEDINFDNALKELDASIEAFEHSAESTDEPTAGNISNTTQEIEFDSALLEMDSGEDTSGMELDTPEPEANTSNEMHEIEFDSTLLEMDDSDDTIGVANDKLEEEENTSNETQEIEFDSTLLEMDDSDDTTGVANDKLAVEENTSNETQEIEFDSAVFEMEPETSVGQGLADIEELTLEPIPDSPPLSPSPVTEVQSGKKLTPPVSTTEIETLLSEWFEDTGNKKISRQLQKDLKTIKQFAKETEQEEISRIAKDMIAVVKAVQDGESELTDDIRNILQLAMTTLTELFDANATEPVQAAAPVTEIPESPQTETLEQAPDVQPISKHIDLPDEIDDEIAEIFIEEAREEHANISRLLPVWRENVADEETLKEMRRSFHTLKGSGRLVGAKDVGEFAWAFENMLNRVIDHTIDVTSIMFDLLYQALDTLPGLLEMYVHGEKPGQQIFAMMQQAEAISQGRSPDIQPGGEAGHEAAAEDTTQIIQAQVTEATDLPDADTATATTDSEPEIPIEADEVAGGEGERVPEIDETLLDIYRKEVESHLAVLHGYIEDWRDDVDRSANARLIRTVHTLTGCSRTAAVSTLAEVFSAAEKYTKLLESNNALVSEDAVKMLISSIDFTEQTMNVLDRTGAQLPSNEMLLSQIHGLAEQVVPDEDIAQAESNVAQLPPVDSRAPISQAAQPEYDEELLGIFIEEGMEILDESDQTLHQWSADKLNPEYISAMQRLLHTLKGGARLAGLTEMGDLSHSVESMLEAIVEGQLEMSEQVYEILMAAQDDLVNMLDKVKLKQALTPSTDIINTVERLLAGDVGDTRIEPEEPAIEPPEAENEPSIESIELSTEVRPDPAASAQNVPDNVIPLTSLARINKQQPAIPEEETLPAERVQAKELVRVRSELLDNLVNFAGEVSIYRSRMEQQTNAFRYNLQELDDTVDRLREQLRKFEMEAEAQIQYRAEESFSHAHEDFDPLEFDRFTQMQQLSRGMMESLNDLDSLRAILSGLTRESETLLVQQSRVNTELQEGLMRTRMVPFNTQANRLRRIVRQTAEELGKNAELHLHGADSEIDRTVLERLLPALEHMLRNAVAHGVESPELRRRLNKNEMGQINLTLSRDGADIMLNLVDDGAGIDLAAIQSKAIEKGKLKADSHVTKEILFDLIMESGFSTAEEVTQIAGRGVGMDVVNNEIKQLGGLLKIDTEQGKGTSFTINLPLTLSLTRALMVQVGEETYALPLLSVEGVERISSEQLQALYDQDKPVYQWLGQDYPFIHLGSAMGISQAHVPTDRARIPLLLVRSGEYCAAVQVDNLIGSREIVVKPVGPQLSTMRGIAGATIMGDGSVVLIIDLGVLVRSISIQEELLAETVEPPPALEPQSREPVIMVIDDSITVRKVTTRLLERNDYRAVSAKDGVDALAQLQEMKPDVMLLDVEMPRMDGFELATNVRNDERLRDIPIIMITSRTGKKHRDRAEKIGVNIYMGKPYGEAELLENIKSLLAQQH